MTERAEVSAETDALWPAEDHAPGKVRWPSDVPFGDAGAVMDRWVQAALNDPRPGDVFHEMYAFGVQVTAVDSGGVHWRSFNTGTLDSGVKTRTEWAESFRYGGVTLTGRHVMSLLTRGEPYSPAKAVRSSVRLRETSDLHTQLENALQALRDAQYEVESAQRRLQDREERVDELRDRMRATP